MANEMTAAQDYRRCAQLWQRVDPTLDPYPARTPEEAEARAAELTLPGAEADPCCMGTEAMQSVDVLRGFVREELSDHRSYLFLARHAPTALSRRVFQSLASEEEQHARRLFAALYLITGERYTPAICYPPLVCGDYWKMLRERYHDEACGGFNYHRAAQEALDPCLQQLLMEFSDDEYRHARQLMNLLAAALGRA